METTDASPNLENAANAAMHHVVSMLCEWHSNWEILQSHSFIVSDLRTFLRDWNEHYGDNLSTMTIQKMLEHLRLLEYILTRKIELAKMQHGGHWTTALPTNFEIEDMEMEMTTTYSIVEQIVLYISGILPLPRITWSEDDRVQDTHEKHSANLVDRYAIAWRTPLSGDRPVEKEPEKPAEEALQFEDGSRKQVVATNWVYTKTPHWHCPVCGKNLFGVTGVTACRHMLIACFEGELIGTNPIGTAMIGGKRPDLVPEDLFKEEDVTPYQVLKAAYSTGSNFVLSSTTRNIPGPHPVAHVEILFECKESVLEGKGRRR